MAVDNFFPRIGIRIAKVLLINGLKIGNQMELLKSHKRR